MLRLKSLVGNSLYIAVSTITLKLANLAILPWITRVYSPEEFGQFDLGMMYVGLLLPVLSLCIQESVFRFIQDDFDNRDRVLGLSVLLMLIILISGSLVLLIVRAEMIWFLLLILLVTQFAVLLSEQYLRAIGEIRQSTYMGLIIALLSTIGVVLVLMLKAEISFIFVSYILGNITGVILFSKLRISDLDFAVDSKWKSFVAFSLPLIPNRLFWWLNNSIGRIGIVQFIGVSELGVYAATMRIPGFLVVVQSVFVQAWKMSVKQNGGEISLSFNGLIYKIYLWTLVIVGSCIIWKVDFILQLLGTKFRGESDLISVALISVLFGGLIGYFEMLILALKATRILVFPTAIGAVMNTTLIFSLQLSLYKVALIGALSYLVILLILRVRIWRVAETRVASWYNDVVLLLIPFIWLKVDYIHNHPWIIILFTLLSILDIVFYHYNGKNISHSY